MHLLANYGKCITASCGKDVSKILYEKAVLFSHKGQEYKLITNTLRIRKDTAVKIIQSTLMIRKLPAEMCILGVRGSLSHRNEYKVIIKMQKIPNVGLYDTIGIYVAAFQHPNAFIPYLYI